MSDVVEVYYKNDENVKKDDEIQAFVLEVSSQGLKNCGDHGEDRIIKQYQCFYVSTCKCACLHIFYVHERT